MSFLLLLLLLLRSPFWVRFLHVWPFLDPSIEVVTFRLRGLGFTNSVYSCRPSNVYIATTYPTLLPWWLLFYFNPINPTRVYDDSELTTFRWKLGKNPISRSKLPCREKKPNTNARGSRAVAEYPSCVSSQYFTVGCPSSCYRLVGLVVRASASRVEGPRFESRLRRDFFGVESYQWLKNWHSSGYPARRLAL